MKSLKNLILRAGGIILITGSIANARAELQTVGTLNLAKYSGTWYEIARNNLLPFEWGCVCARQQLTPQNDGKIAVYNSCNFWTPEGKLREIRGVAEVADTTTNAKLKVDFKMPWKGNYWVIAVDPDYRWAVVSDPSRWSLYVLSKTPMLETELYKQALVEAAKQSDTRFLQATQQVGCGYPAN